MNASKLKYYQVEILTLQQGQQKPDIFSTMPIIGNPILWQKLISFRMVSRLISCGVVTRMTPSGLADFRNFTTERCSSLVPGGVSG